MTPKEVLQVAIGEFTARATKERQLVQDGEFEARHINDRDEVEVIMYGVYSAKDKAEAYEGCVKYLEDLSSALND